MLPETFNQSFLRQIELLRVRARKSFLGSKQGGHISLRKGHGIEFSDYRKYELGDNPRHIDWGVYGRSDRLFVKRFQEEEDLSVLLVIDGSASMTSGPSWIKWQAARDLAISLAYTALMEQDRVTFCVPGHLHSAHYSGAKAIHSIGTALTGDTFVEKLGGNPNFKREMQLAATRIRFPGKAIVISDFLFDLATIQAGFNILRSKNLDITAIQLLSDNDQNPYIELDHGAFLDSETGEIVNVSLDDDNRAQYEEHLTEHNQALQEYFLGAQIQYTYMRAEDDLLQFIVNNLTSIGLLKRN